MVEKELIDGRYMHTSSSSVASLGIPSYEVRGPCTCTEPDPGKSVGSVRRTWYIELGCWLSASKTTHVIMRFRSGVLDNLPLLGLVHLGLCRRHASNGGCGCPSGGDSSCGTDHGVGENGWKKQAKRSQRRLFGVRVLVRT